MKRSGPPTRRAPLRQNSPLQRGKGLGRGSGSRKARRRSDPRYTAAKQEAASRQMASDPGTKPDLLWCAGCKRRLAVDPHHVFPEQKWPALLCHPDNIVWLCRECHDGHESAQPRRRLARYAIGRAERLAVTDAMRDYLARTYPNREEKR